MLSIIQVYAPTNQAEKNEKEQFYQIQSDTYKNDREYYTVVLGDFNAKVGNENVNDT